MFFAAKVFALEVSGGVEGTLEEVAVVEQFGRLVESSATVSLILEI